MCHCMAQWGAPLTNDRSVYICVYFALHAHRMHKYFSHAYYALLALFPFKL